MSNRSRVALIESAALLFRRQGYAATGVNQILAAADVKAGSLYHHFPDGKAELAAAVVDGVGGDIARLLRTFLASERPPAEIVATWIDMLAVGLDGDQRDGCPIEPIATESVHASAQVRDRAHRRGLDPVAHRRRPVGARRRQGRRAHSSKAAELTSHSIMKRCLGKLLVQLPRVHNS
jgi:TetR/AcrR family transcriptional repressor of lmrAB and yxaGH operons